MAEAIKNIFLLPYVLGSAIYSSALKKPHGIRVDDNESELISKRAWIISVVFWGLIASLIIYFKAFPYRVVYACPHPNSSVKCYKLPAEYSEGWWTLFFPNGGSIDVQCMNGGSVCYEETGDRGWEVNSTWQRSRGYRKSSG